MTEENIFKGIVSLNAKVTAVINWLRSNDDAIADDANIPMGDVDDAIDLLANLYKEEEND